MKKSTLKSLIKTLQIYPGSCCILTSASSDDGWAHSVIEKAIEEARIYRFKLLQNLIHWLQEQGFFGKRIQVLRNQRKMIHNRLRKVFIIDRILHECKIFFEKSRKSID